MHNGGGGREVKPGSLARFMPKNIMAKSGQPPLCDSQVCLVIQLGSPPIW